MDRRTFFSRLFTTGLLLKLTRWPDLTEGTELSETDLSSLLTERLFRDPIWSYAVPNYPLSATLSEDQHTLFPDGRQTTHTNRGRLVRDGDGRVRFEEHAVNAQRDDLSTLVLTAKILDPLIGELYVLFLNERLAAKWQYDPAEQDSSNLLSVKEDMELRWRYENIQVRSLGTMMLEGMECSGQIITASAHTGIEMNPPFQVSVEDWIAPSSTARCSPKHLTALAF